ncbi:NAD-dependent epimerase/dehydratase family protein [Nonomuraea deserti]|uniref:NAD-dependent epimerase/dehydratase family protein n=1 Tax=Nonomuraea deserti TaxID=1848322 RepID=A0A4R4USA8_9ACTN|nr:NmrA family NAD(P)-binding protein [Nonomuraea deserti]TDC93256.1 NAD-dependent epimerase/dehydratase family protein [Nonomuraea deserti]
MSTVFVAGATGRLGRLIVDSLRRRDVRVRALVRPGNTEGRQAFDDPAIEIVEGDIRDPADRLTRALQGVDVVVSAVQGGAEVIIDGQVNLLRAAEQAGVPRWIPSDFSLGIDRLDYGDNDFADLRKRAAESYRSSTVAPTSVLIGAFLEVLNMPFYNWVDWESGTFNYWGDGDQPVDFSTYSDTAEWTAEVALDPSAAGRTVRVAGDVLTLKELRRAMERGSGRRLEARQLGTTDDLRAEIECRKAVATDAFEYLLLQYNWAMVTGKGKLDPLDNHRYPGIQPIGAEEYFRQTMR